MILLGLLGLALIAVLIGKLVRALLAIMRLSLAIIAALALAAVATPMLGFDANTDPQVFIGIFVLGLLPAAWLALRGRHHTRKVDAVRVPTKAPIEHESTVKPEVALLNRLEASGRIRRWDRRRKREVAMARRLAASWAILAEVGDGHRARIAVAKRGCDRLVSLSEGVLMSPSAIDALIGIRNGVPNLTETCLRHMMSVSDAGGRAHAMSRAVDACEDIAARAEREADALARDHASAFDLTSAHLQRRSSEDRLTI